MESEATETKIYSTEFFYPKEFRILIIIGKCSFTFLLVFESNTFFLWKMPYSNQWGSIRRKQIARWLYLSGMKNVSYCL